jgi:prophage regulatory protein
MKLLGINELTAAKGVPFSRPHLYRLIAARKFPKPVRLGENRVAFIESEIDEWLEARIRERDQEAA